MDTHSVTSSLAIELNNSAVSLILAGYHEQALTTLITALTESRRKVLEGDDAPHCFTGKVSLDDFMKQSLIDGDYCDELNDTNEIGFMYRHPLHIPSDLPANCLVLSSVAIIFNLALAYQLSAMSSSGRSVKAKSQLRKAAKLYKLAYNLYCKEALQSATFVMACVNNLGLTHFVLNNRSSAKKCFELLLSTLMFLVDCGRSHHLSLDGFFRNASHLLGQAPTSSAA